MPTVRFRDPFNDATWVGAYIFVLGKMFGDAVDPRFTIIDQAASSQVCCLRLDLTCRNRPGSAPWRIEVMSELHFDIQGRVVAHLDQWEHWASVSRCCGRPPLLGGLLRLVRQRVSVR